MDSIRKKINNVAYLSYTRSEETYAKLCREKLGREETFVKYIVHRIGNEDANSLASP